MSIFDGFMVVVAFTAGLWWGFSRRRRPGALSRRCHLRRSPWRLPRSRSTGFSGSLLHGRFWLLLSRQLRRFVDGGRVTPAGGAGWSGAVCSSGRLRLVGWRF